MYICINIWALRARPSQAGPVWGLPVCQLGRCASSSASGHVCTLKHTHTHTHIRTHIDRLRKLRKITFMCCTHYVQQFMPVCVCSSEIISHQAASHAQSIAHTHTHVYVYVYIHMHTHLTPALRHWENFNMIFNILRKIFGSGILAQATDYVTCQHRQQRWQHAVEWMSKRERDCDRKKQMLLHNCCIHMSKMLKMPLSSCSHVFPLHFLGQRASRLCNIYINIFIYKYMHVYVHLYKLSYLLALCVN